MPRIRLEERTKDGSKAQNQEERKSVISNSKVNIYYISNNVKQLPQINLDNKSVKI